MFSRNSWEVTFCVPVWAHD